MTVARLQAGPGHQDRGTYYEQWVEWGMLTPNEQLRSLLQAKRKLEEARVELEAVSSLALSSVIQAIAQVDREITVCEGR